MIAGADEDLDLESLESPVELPPPKRLKVPQPYVLASDKTTKLTLEQAGLLKPGGRAWALVLGKALFWDQQTGSDKNGCASCHAAAGADHRITNQLSPGFKDVTFGTDGDTTFGSIASDTQFSGGLMPSGAQAGPNYKLVPEDFPLHVLEDKKHRNSNIVTTTNDSISSQGSFDQVFRRLDPHGGDDRCTPRGEVFDVKGLPGRQVEPRNTPTTINAAFFHLNFWDGRASHIFNGFGVHGLRDVAGDPNRRLIVSDGGMPRLTHLEVHNASLASQAVGPPTSGLEMSCVGRTFPDVGRKLLRARPLEDQKVSPTDSILGRFANPWGKGLKHHYDYRYLIEKAFPEAFWKTPGRFRIVNGQLVHDPRGYTQMETNFSMFWGIAIMLYEQTLISDQSRFDEWFESCRPQVQPNPGLPATDPTVKCFPLAANPNQSDDPTTHGFDAREVIGFALFSGGGVGIRDVRSPACSGCHPLTNLNAVPFLSPTFSEAAFQEGQAFVPVERSLVTDPGAGLPATNEGGSHDRGFFSLGLRAATTDLGIGANDPYGNPLSIARMFVREQAGQSVVDPSGIGNRCATATLVEPGGTPGYPGCPPPGTPNPQPSGPLDANTERFLVDGSFKTPSIRNVGLTPPYFHYGGYSNLHSVVEVYARGGSKRDKPAGSTGDWSGTGRLGNGTLDGTNFGTNVDFFIHDFGPADPDQRARQIDALVAFMLTTTDERVRCDMAPFDHPEIELTNGHEETCRADGLAEDRTFTLPAVGAGGYRGYNARFCIPNAGDLFAPGMGARRGGE